MMRRCSLLLCCLPGLAFATDVSGDQFGVWDPALNPYRITDDVRVPPGQTLILRPGVEVRGLAAKKLVVDSGATLMALGSEAAPIRWTAEDTVAGWRGIRLLGASDASVIDRCVFEYAKGTGSYPEVQGGAIVVRNCSPTISNSLFQNNSSMNSNFNGVGAGVYTETSSATIVGNTFLNNRSDSGGGVCAMEFGSPAIRGNLFDSNSARYAGGGLYMGARSSPFVDGNRFLRNSSGGYGGGAINSWTAYIFSGTYATIRNNLIARNSAGTGAGIYCRYDRAILTNNTIVDNVGDGVYAINYPAQAPILTGCILWGNTGGAVRLETSTGSLIFLNYCLVQGGYAGQGNINADPWFVDPASDDYRLTATSPAIDAASNGELAGVEADLDGLPRFIDQPEVPDTGSGAPPLADIGAYELQKPGEFLPSRMLVTRGVAAGGGVPDLWFSDDRRALVNGRPQALPSAASAEIEAVGTCPDRTPTGLTVRVETSTNGRPARLRIDAFDFVGNTWIRIDERDAPAADAVVEAPLPGDPARYFEPGTRKTRLRVGYQDLGVLFPAWTARFDQVVWLLR